MKARKTFTNVVILVLCPLLMFLQAVLLLAVTSWELEFFLTSRHWALISVHCGTCGILKIGPTCLFRRSLVVKDLWNHSTPWVPWHDFTGAPLKFWEVAPRSLLRGLETFYSPKLFFFPTWNIPISGSHPSFPAQCSFFHFFACTVSKSVFREQTWCLCPPYLLLHPWLSFTPVMEIDDTSCHRTGGLLD